MGVLERFFLRVEDVDWTGQKSWSLTWNKRQSLLDQSLTTREKFTLFHTLLSMVTHLIRLDSDLLYVYNFGQNKSKLMRAFCVTTSFRVHNSYSEDQNRLKSSALEPVEISKINALSRASELFSKTFKRFQNIWETST